MSAYLDNCDSRQLAEPFVRQRFMFAETWFFRLLEDILVSERRRNPNNVARIRVQAHFVEICVVFLHSVILPLQKLVDCEKFQKSLFALAIEIVLFSYNCLRYAELVQLSCLFGLSLLNRWFL